MFTFADSFDFYATMADPLLGYWDSGLGVNGNNTLVAGRFTGSQAVSMNLGSGPTVYYVKSSAVNDAVHHIVLAFRQTATITGTTLGAYFQLSDAATNQVCIVFRSDGAILLTSATPAGTVLATYSGAVTAVNIWYGFEFEVIIHPTAGRFRARKNGNTVDDYDSGATLNTRPGTNSYANKLTIGMQATVTNHQFDDLLWRSDPTSVAWMGDIRCYTRMPASDAGVQFSKSPASFSITPYTFLTTLGITAGTAFYSPFTPTFDGTVATISVNINTGYTGNLKCSMFATAANAPAAVLGSATTIVNPVTGNNTFTFVTPISVTKGTTYFFGLNSDTSSGFYARSTTSGVGFTGTTVSYASFPVASPTSLTTQNTTVFTYVLTPTNVSLVNETLQDGTTTYVYDSTVGHADFYNIAAASSALASVVAVTTRGFIEKSDAGARSGAVQLRSGTGGDPNISNVTLLCHFNGTSGSTAFVDSSGSAHTLTATNGANLSNAQTKFGTASGNFAAGTTAYAAVGGSLSDFEFGSAPFTIEAWVYATTTPAVSSILSRFNNLTTDAFFFGTIFDIGFYYVDGTGTVQAWTAPGFTVSTGVWHHIAVDRDATNTTRLYRDGVVIATQSIPTIHSSSQLCYIGNDQGLARNWPGYIDDLRVTKGVARYAGAFTPPTLTFPDTGVSTVQSTSTPLSSSFTWLYRTDSIDPNTGSAWTPAAVDGLQIGPVVTA